MRTLFEVLGVEPRYHLAADELEQKFKALSLKLHPDRFARAPAAERVRALSQSTELNDAYRVLKVPARRGEYLLKLCGLDITEEGGPGGSRVQIDPDLLLELLEEREALAAAKAAGDRATIVAMQQAAETRRAAGMSALDELFTRHERGDQSVVMALAQQLIELRYADKFLAEVDAIFDGLDQVA